MKYIQVHEGSYSKSRKVEDVIHQGKHFSVKLPVLIVPLVTFSNKIQKT